MSDIKQIIREKFTYHSDEGTSGYELSEEQFEKIDQIIDLAIAEERKNTLKELEEEVENLKRNTLNKELKEDYMCGHPQTSEAIAHGHNQALDDIKQLIHQKVIKQI